MTYHSLLRRLSSKLSVITTTINKDNITIYMCNNDKIPGRSFYVIVTFRPSEGIKVYINDDEEPSYSLHFCFVKSQKEIEELICPIAYQYAKEYLL